MKTLTLKKRIKNWLEIPLHCNSGWNNKDGTFQFCTKWMLFFGAKRGKDCIMRISRKARVGYTKINLTVSWTGTWHWATENDTYPRVFMTAQMDEFLSKSFRNDAGTIWIKIVPKP